MFQPIPIYTQRCLILQRRFKQKNQTNPYMSPETSHVLVVGYQLDDFIQFFNIGNGWLENSPFPSIPVSLAGWKLGEVSPRGKTIDLGQGSPFFTLPSCQRGIPCRSESQGF